ncbi:hypothetical protein HPB47_023780 [Ixodes persulcatus]|uniref:Uncharacterized protein n=1 Tax=Ixodes persulcatus TaxID=34615 RepID=A0AC60Q8B8_IXOPE|nr:hypothetical protein HPB47_023780 [Ixodes persulcatus]
MKVVAVASYDYSASLKTEYGGKTSRGQRQSSPATPLHRTSEGIGLWPAPWIGGIHQELLKMLAPPSNVKTAVQLLRRDMPATWSSAYFVDDNTYPTQVIKIILRNLNVHLSGREILERQTLIARTASTSGCAAGAASDRQKGLPGPLSFSVVLRVPHQVDSTGDPDLSEAHLK